MTLTAASTVEEIRNQKIGSFWGIVDELHKEHSMTEAKIVDEFENIVVRWVEVAVARLHPSSASLWVDGGPGYKTLPNVDLQRTIIADKVDHVWSNLDKYSGSSDEKIANYAKIFSQYPMTAALSFRLTGGNTEYENSFNTAQKELVAVREIITGYVSSGLLSLIQTGFANKY